MKKALIIVDVQNDFCPGGALPVPGGDQVVPILNEYGRRFAAAGAPVYASRDWHPPVTTHFREHGGAWPAHCVQGQPGAAHHPHLRLPEGAVIVSKGLDPKEDSYSCFQAVGPDGTLLAPLLRRQGVDHLYVGGLATDYCVRATVLDALKEGFRATVLIDACRGVDLEAGDTERAIVEMINAGAEVTTLEKLELE